MYTIAATMVGYGTEKKEAVQVIVDYTSTVDFALKEASLELAEVGCRSGAPASGAGQNHEQIRGFFGRYSGCAAGEIDLAVDRIATGYGAGWHQPHSAEVQRRCKRVRRWAIISMGLRSIGACLRA